MIVQYILTKEKEANKNRSKGKKQKTNLRNKIIKSGTNQKKQMQIRKNKYKSEKTNTKSEKTNTNRKRALKIKINNSGKNSQRELKFSAGRRFFTFASFCRLF